MFRCKNFILTTITDMLDKKVPNDLLLIQEQHEMDEYSSLKRKQKTATNNNKFN